jgi:hypothetical protein
MEKEEFVKMVFEHKLSIVKETTSSMMLWWVTSVVFCGSLLGGVLFNQEKIINLSPPYIYHVVFSLIVLFFLSIILFGFSTANQIRKIKLDILSKYESFASEESLKLQEFDAIIRGIKIGTSSFIFALLVFLLIWGSMILSP